MPNQRAGQVVTASRFHGRWARIAPRLLAGFVLPILLTGAIGFVAVQRFSALTTTTTELTALDLPEVFTVTHLRGLLYEQLNLERSAMGSQAAQAALSKILRDQRKDIQSLEPLNATAGGTNDAPLVRTLLSNVPRSIALAERAAALRVHGQDRQAAALYRQEERPLLLALIADTGQLRALEQNEATAAAAQAQRESRTATWLVLALTLLSIPVSVLVASVLTRSLTRPLSALLQATRELAAGNLEASPHVASNDEIGQLATAFDTMRSNLQSMIVALDLERQRTQAIIDASSDGVILVDQDQKITQLNPAAEHLSGWLAPDAVGQTWWTVFGCSTETAAGILGGSAVAAGNATAGGVAPPEQETAEPDGHGVGEAVQTELLIHSRGGEERWLAVSSAPVAWNGDASTRRTVLNFHDISDLKAIDRLKSDFVAMVSHELRAPLTTVGGAVEMLATVDPSTDMNAYREVVAILEQQTRRLRNVIEEVLQVTRLEARQMPVRLEPLPLAAYLRSIVATMRDEWGDDARVVSVETGEETVVWADRNMLEIVLRNLVDNARKYTPRDSSIEIEMTTDDSGDRVLVRVIDHGPGIPRDQIDHIFDRFSRGAQSSYNCHRGYGLGLYIARELVHAHNGEIWVEHRADGACFAFSLWPVARDELSEAPVEREAV